MCFVSRPVKIVTFPLEKRDTTKGVVDFPRERDTFRNKIMEIVKDFDEKSYNNNGKEREERGMMYFLSFLALFGNFKSKNLLLNVFVQFFSVF